MKPKVHSQVNPRQTVPPRCEQVQVQQDEVQEEIRNFLRAVDSYPARASKEPSVSFHQHLCSIFAAGATRAKRP